MDPLVPNQKRGRRPILHDINAEAEDLLRDFYTVPEAEGLLIDKYHDAAPSRRHLFRLRAKIKPRDPSDPWVIANEINRDALMLTPSILADVIERSKGKVRQLTLHESRRITFTRLVAPDLPPLFVYLVAREYVRADILKQPTDSLDLFLSFAPWQPERAPKYERCIVAGWIQKPPAFLNVFLSEQYRIRQANKEETRGK